jgi:hypothetical protein
MSIHNKEINERIIAVRGKVNTDRAHYFGQDIPVVVTVTGIEKVDNQDGTVNEIYKCKLFEEVE